MSNSRHFTTAPTLDELDELARQAFATIPDELRRHCEGLVIRIADFPDEDVIEEMELETPFDLLGLYQGVSLERRSTQDSGSLPDMIFLYRRPLLDFWCETGEDLKALVRHVMIHEIGHHFGFSDEDMEALEQGD
ncbi:MAG: metallopeptidase family protein [Alphaproteobacteria bacterium]|nr:metallopeptidase family protein [Alphaproteobacteria bacterium]